jgi:hypothetical protein
MSQETGKLRAALREIQMLQVAAFEGLDDERILGLEQQLRAVAGLGLEELLEVAKLRSIDPDELVASVTGGFLGGMAAVRKQQHLTRTRRRNARH